MCPISVSNWKPFKIWIKKPVIFRKTPNFMLIIKVGLKMMEYKSYVICAICGQSIIIKALPYFGNDHIPNK